MEDQTGGSVAACLVPLSSAELFLGEQKPELAYYALSHALELSVNGLSGRQHERP